MSATVQRIVGRLAVLVMFVGVMSLSSGVAFAQAEAGAPEHHGGEAALVVPDLSSVTFLGGIDGHTLLMSGLVICALGLLFGLMTFSQLKNLPVHKSMLEVSELIYETCKTYLTTQGKFIMVLWGFIAVIIAA